MMESDHSDSTSDGSDDSMDLIRMVLLEDDSTGDESNIDEGGRQLRTMVNVDAWRRLGDPTFEKQFRMDCRTFELLLNAVAVHLAESQRVIRQPTSELDIVLLSVLWILATQDTFRSTAIKFGLNPGSVHYHYKYLIACLREMAPQYIRWPSHVEREMIAARFERLYGYPDVVGCVDGCHITITAPLEQPQRYVDRHHQYSILLQGVCDDRLLFRDIYVGQPGSVGDKRTFKRSPLGQNILVDPDVVGEKHLLGDGGYTLTSKLIIPYRNLGNLTPRQRAHNYHLSRCRSCIERAFALLKGKWRRLKLFPNYCLEYAIDHIIACCVLHNFVILNGEAYEDREEIDIELPDNLDAAQLLREAKADGIAKRDFIANVLL